MHYDKYAYMTEKREALQLLEDFLSSFGVDRRTAAPYEQAASPHMSQAQQPRTACVTADALRLAPASSALTGRKKPLEFRSRR